MRRWLILFLVFVLPLQLSWAAAGIACAHETGPAADHFGHHVHQHQDSGKSVEHGKSVADKGQADTDCPYCHVSVPTPVVEFHFFDAPLTSSTALPESLSWRAWVFEEAPEKPNWRMPS